jgi:RNA polymerase sigma factor (sigma-70 family)
MALGEHPSKSGVFATTHWSVVLTAGPNNSAAAAAAWEKLAGTYWYPVYAHVRRRVGTSLEAEDLVQGFFESLLKRQSLGQVDPERGRFRTFLLSALNYFLSDQLERINAAKRGGGQVVSFDALEAEQRFLHEPLSGDAPDREFDRRWAETVVERALGHLETEQRQAGREREFEVLQEFLAREVGSGEYEPVAQQLSLSSNAVAAAVRRLRHRLRTLTLAELTQTTASLADGEAELRRLFG